MKMKMVKKLLTVTLAVVLTAGVLAGCGNKDGGSEGKVTIRVPDRVLTEVGADAFVKQKQLEFDELYGDTIEVIHMTAPASSDVNDVQNTAAILMGQDAPSYVILSSTIYVKDLYNMGLIRDIGDVVEELGYLDGLMSRAVEACKYSDGALIGYPLSLEIPLLGFYNSALTEAGYNPDKFTCNTWDEYYVMAENMTNSAHKGGSLYASEFFLWPQNWFLSNGAQVAIQNNDGTISLNYTDEKVVETVEFMRKLYHAGYTNTNIGYTDVDSMFGLLYGKSVASFTMYPTWLERFAAQGIEPNEITLRTFPQGPSGEYASVMYVSAAALNSQLTDEEAKATLTYLNFMNSEEYWNEYFAYCELNSISKLSIPAVENADWWSHLTDFPQQWIDTIKSSLETATDTPMNSTGYSTYISAMLPEIITGQSDIVEGLKKAEKLTKSEWLDNYNTHLNK